MDLPAALHRLTVGVPATVEHSSEAGPETGKWVAETTQVSPQPFIPDALG
jgi:ESCRT-I complex subunit VPS28